MKDLFTIRVIFLIITLLCSNGFALPDDPSSIRFAGVPAIGFGPDSGFGGGVIGNMYVDEAGFRPYKMAVGLKAYLTTKGINSHYLQIDRLRAFSLPLRLTARVGFFSTIAQNYCGRASDANCDEDRARTEADVLGLSGTPRNEFIEHFYKNRFMSIYADIFARWLLFKNVAKLELMTSYRGNYYLNRDFTTKGLYAGSLYERDFKNHKTEGYLSTLELGLMLDRRDNEPAPTSGYWLEASVRGGSWLIGSAWDYFGGNVSLRFYFPFDDAHSLVFGTQSIMDMVVGDLPFDAISRIGGSQSLNGVNAIGGQYIGRGIMEQRYVGRIKAIEQLELRYTFLSFTMLKQDFDLTAAMFSDFAMTAWDLSRFTKDMKDLYVSFGSGLRIHWNKRFIVRADLGASPNENFSPKFYLTVGNVF